jgi:hypothetical protein
MIIPGSRVKWRSRASASEPFPDARIWRTGTILDIVIRHRAATGAVINTYAVIKRDIDGKTTHRFLSNIQEIPCDLQDESIYERRNINGEYIPPIPRRGRKAGVH